MSLLFHNNENKKDIFLKAYKKSLGNVTMSCTAANITLSDYNRALVEDVKFRQSIADLDQAEIDFGESKLKERMQKGDTRAIIYFLNNKGKERGYGESLKIRGDKEEPLVIQNKIPDLKDLSSEQKRILASIARTYKESSSD